MLEFPLNENRTWGQGEDVEWSRQIKNIIKFKMNINSSVKLLKQKEKAAATGGGTALPDGGEIYNGNCVACHQANGEGLAGAFPPLKGSPIVLGEDLKLYVTIIMKGYDARPEYATMTDVGTAANFTPEMVAALINHERTSWGNQGKKVTAEEVKKIMDEIK